MGSPVEGYCHAIINTKGQRRCPDKLQDQLRNSRWSIQWVGRGSDRSDYRVWVCGVRIHARGEKLQVPTYPACRGREVGKPQRRQLRAAKVQASIMLIKTQSVQGAPADSFMLAIQESPMYRSDMYRSNGFGIAPSFRKAYGRTYSSLAA